MKINRDNYEAYFLDYHEGQLSPEMVEEVLMFVEQNPDLKNAFDEFEAVSLVADQDIVFEKKSSLKKNQIFATAQVNELNYEEYLIGETEGILNAEQLASIVEFISINPQFEKDRRLFALAHLSSEDKIVFEAKESLKQKAFAVGPINADTFETYMARELEGDLNQDEKLLLAEFMQYNPHLEQDRNLYKHTILSAETGIVFENKSSLKQSVTPIRRIVYYALSAAASLALIVSFYFLLDRNDIPHSIAEQGSVKTKISSTVADPSAIVADKQVAAAVKQPAKAVTIPSQGNNETESTITTKNTGSENQGTEFLAANDRHSVESLQAKSAAEITTRSYVDPQFTFIRTSQMYMNQNREFYYNMKLAEQIEYAQLNQKDKEPAKTILNAITGQARGLLVSNKPAPSQEEKKNFSLWTFAELGVQTFNTITSGEMELNLNKDEDGKVVSYNLESGLFDVEREVKK
ncbi:MAG: hypothetical protein Q7U54_06805 [Bacteroidales bacterium]|nr:hypothetical protein [Bacteroidales bacterium]